MTGTHLEAPQIIHQLINYQNAIPDPNRFQNFHTDCHSVIAHTKLTNIADERLATVALLARQCFLLLDRPGEKHWY